MANPLKKWWFWSIVFLAGLVQAVILAGPGISKHLYERKVSQQEREWLDRATEAVADGTTPSQAEEWLNQNRFSDVAYWLAQQTTERTGEPAVESDYSVVAGTRQLSAGGLLLKPAWVELSFHFTRDGKQFLRVESRIKR